MNTKNVSATNVRVNLTEVISELDANNRVAITKHGKVIAYLVAHVEEVVSPKVLMDILDDEEEEVEVDAGELACETTAGPNYEPDLDLDEESFDDYLEDLRRQTMSLGFFTN
tara:strand:- start:1380 stop:1715 length:336 start_codon:yes stop_codon:yes gene_type:complete